MTRLKPLEQQTIVLTGATSGIGLVTARRASRRGARLVLAARNEDALRQLADEIRGQGGEAVPVVADVGVEEEVERIAEEAVRHFGGFDTWVNNAAVAIYGRLDQVEIKDMRRLFDTNFWGAIYGSLTALRYLRDRPAGKIVNLGSVLGERAIPIQGIYSASKHALAGFTEALRIEIDMERLPVSVTLVKPSAIDTPYKRHAKNYLDKAPQNPPPVYAPDLVADAILYAAEHDVRDLVVGGGGRIINAMSNLMPRTTDRIMARLMPYLQRSRDPARPIEEHALYRPGEGLSERGGYGFTRERSLYTAAQTHPLAAAALGAGLVAATIALWRGRRA